MGESGNAGERRRRAVIIYDANREGNQRRQSKRPTLNKVANKTRNRHGKPQGVESKANRSQPKHGSLEMMLGKGGKNSKGTMNNKGCPSMIGGKETRPARAV